MQPGGRSVQPGAPHRPAPHSLGADENARIFYFRSQSGGERECSRGACLCSLGRRTDRCGTVWELMKMPVYSISGLSLVGSGSAAGAPACAAWVAFLCSLGRRTDRRGTVWELMKMPIYCISGLSQVGSGSAARAPACAAWGAAQTDAAQSGSS